ncbi:hypothetical protein [Methylorubrum aminovorans]
MPDRVELASPMLRTAAMNVTRLAETEAVLTQTDRAWRSELVRLYGADGVLKFGYGREGRGEDGTIVRRTYDARQHAIASWRHERRTRA